MLICSLADDEYDDSDKENSQRGSQSARCFRSSRSLFGAASTASNSGHVLRELPVSSASERKSLRDRKGERAGRNGSKIGTPTISPTPSASTSSAQATETSAVPQLPVQASMKYDDDGSNLNTSMPVQTSPRLDAHEHQAIPPHERLLDEITGASARLQEVLKLEDSETKCSVTPQPTPTADAGGDDESFDPDSPLPMSRAPRHSLLLSLTTSPIRAAEVSPSKSSSESPSPPRDDMLFTPEYHHITTPSRIRTARAFLAGNDPKSPACQTVSRHRDSRLQRREQAVLERQATISNKLSAVSLTMSGLGASAYGGTSTPYRHMSSISGKQSGYSAAGAETEHTRAGTDTGRAATSNPASGPATAVILDDVFHEPLEAKLQSRTISSPEQHSQGVPEHNTQQQGMLETAVSRIPKPVIPPTQPVFRKPVVSNLPVLRLSTSTMKSSTIQKPASTITATSKAVRPEIASQSEHPKIGTPVRGRLPNTLAFRSPAASRVISASNPAKPIQTRIVSGSLASSTSGAVRPITPGKSNSRSVGAGETAPPTPCYNGNLGASMVHNPSDNSVVSFFTEIIGVPITETYIAPESP